MFGKEELEKEISWEEFERKYLLGEMKGWLSSKEKPRKLRSWLFAVERYVTGNH